MTTQPKYSIERQFPSGAWHVSTIHNGHLLIRRYFGFTKREALACFDRELKRTVDNTQQAR